MSGSRNLFFWGVEITGPQAGERVGLFDAGKQSLMSKVVEEGRPLRLTALRSGDDQRPLILSRDISAVGPAVASRSIAPGIEVHRQQLSRAGRITLPAPCLQIVPTTIWGAPGLAAVTRDELLAYDLSNPYTPHLIHRWSMDELSGARTFGDRLLVFGAGGLAAIGRELRLELAGETCEYSPILDVAVGREAIFVLTDDHIEVRSYSLRRGKNIPSDGFVCLAVAGDRLFAGGPAGISVFDVRDERRPKMLTTRCDLYPTAFLAPPAAPATSVVAMMQNGASVMLHATTKEIVVEGELERTPWFANYAFIGDPMVRARAGETGVEILILGTASLAGPKPSKLTTR